MMPPEVLFDFDAIDDLEAWRVVDDVVMGGRSRGEMVLDTEGHGVFRGDVSLENNGGFSSVRCAMSTTNVSAYNKFVLRLKGDGKRYQFRIKRNNNDYFSYVGYLETTEDWALYEIPFEDMHPIFRGRRLSRRNFPGDELANIGFLIANKKQEQFALTIDYIGMQ